MKNQLFSCLIFTTILFFIGCTSAESPALRECRTAQEQLSKRIAVSDSSLNAHLSELRMQRDAMSADTLLAVDSMLRIQYSSIKEGVNQLEYKQAELHAWRDHLIVLPSKEETAGGIRNPFGENAGDVGILSTLNAYSDTLATLEVTISELIRTTTYERTSPPQPQE
jgi:hypothetical protein